MGLNMNEIKQDITFEDFLKMDLRIGLIKEATRLLKSDKLIKLQVSFGTFERQIVAGIGKNYEVENLLEKQVLFIVNLPMRKIMGVESHGMVLAALTNDNQMPTILKPEDNLARCIGANVG